VDLEAIVGASNRAAKLVAQLAGGTVGGLTDSGQKKSKTKTITCDVNKAGSLLGVNIPSSKAKTIFKALGFKTTGQGGSLKVTVPSFRPDINYEADATEELARIYGYEKIPTTIPAMVSQSKRKDYRRIIEEKSREILLSAGLSEIITYSLISKEALGKFPLPGVERIDVVNPLSSEQEVMRPTILVGMLGASLWNINRKVEGLQIFEIGNVYFKENGQFKEKLTVSIAATGEIVGNWRNRRKADFFTVKGAVETLLSRLGVIGVNFSFEKVSAFSSRESALVKVKDEPIGTIGKVSQEALSRFDIKQDLYASELDLEKIINMVKLKKYYEPLPKYPFVKRDISILLEAKVHAKDVIGAIGEIGIPQVVDVSVFDEYHGKQVPHGKKSLSFSITYQDKAKTLRDQEVEEAHSRIKSTIASKFSAQFR